MRTPIYPAAEALIQTKKLKKYEDQQEAASNTTYKRYQQKKGVKRKETFEEKQAKGNAKRTAAHQPEAKIAQTTILL
ncbi:hypothetical protein MFLAVUS_006461 [Mucor flavus]|uniref:Uncharacterized protein n=1 Tax=Mucor flavus TaxID=439312 RepID=A0ABP9Z1L9_9FUNG